MIDRRFAGALPPKPHTVFRDAAGTLLYEECLTRDGFDGPFTIMHHQGRPHAVTSADVTHGWPLPEAAPPRRLTKRHYRSQALTPQTGAPVDVRVPLLFNRDVVLSSLMPTTSDPVYFNNADADDLYYIHKGGGILRCALGDLSFGEGDYLGVPKGLVHRFVLPEGSNARAQHWLSIECLGGLSLLKQWRNPTGQLRMDAPYNHRDFRSPEFRGPHDEGIRQVLVKRSGAFHAFDHATAPLDVVGWDGTVYPWVFPILAFQPRASSIHLPPIWHGTFATPGALICSFVPRMTDFGPDAIPCPYPHSSVDCDEFLFYCRGQFASRKGVGPGSISHHPAGVTHGPHPGAYEGSIGSQRTDELAVMLDTTAPLLATAAALAIEDPDYERSFLA
ncbi:MAG TPA: homogentisate 1,2-dioxygenase [Polyangia bacterium]